MDRTAKILLLKFVMTFVFAFIALGLLRGNALNWVLVTALAVTAVNYLLGDIIILPSFSNGVASVADGLAAMLIAHVAGVVIFGFRTGLTALLLFGTLIAIGEFIFHQYAFRPQRTK
jgi:hypothetical protein